MTDDIARKASEALRYVLSPFENYSDDAAKGGSMRDTIDMAREAGFVEDVEECVAVSVWVQDTEITEHLKAFEALVRADEREACAELAFEMLVQCEGTDFDVPDAIRARGNT
jgi:hypothetical protein